MGAFFTLPPIDLFMCNSELGELNIVPSPDSSNPRYDFQQFVNLSE
jgi:hypothetical protein